MSFKSLCFTGHRPNKLYGYDPRKNAKLLWTLNNLIEKLITDRNYGIFISGMALGIDMWAARIVLKLRETYPHIKLICAVPCLNHSSKWVESSKTEWKEIIAQADEVVYVTEEPYHPYLMQKRNEWMVDHADTIVAVWNGTKGGTANCVNYAADKEKHVIRLHPFSLKVEEKVK